MSEEQRPLDDSRQKARRAVEAVVATAALVVTAPVLILASIGIALSDPGPVLYRARRIGRDRRRLDPERHDQVRRPNRRRSAYGGREFTLLKLRTMRLNSGSPITAANDPRVFRFGAWLRAAKIDELPQLLNVIRGEMALVGPRPEAPEIVRRHYRAEDLETLQVLPGLTSPGSLYYYAHCESTLETRDATGTTWNTCSRRSSRLTVCTLNRRRSWAISGSFSEPWR